jgi:hypothetical protein
MTVNLGVWWLAEFIGGDKGLTNHVGTSDGSRFAGVHGLQPPRSWKISAAKPREEGSGEPAHVVLEDAERLIAAWNGRQAKQMQMLFSPTIDAAIAAPDTGRSAPATFSFTGGMVGPGYGGWLAGW